MPVWQLFEGSSSQEGVAGALRQRQLGSKLKLKQMGSKGWGVVAGEDIKAGRFVAEYTGEVIPVAEGSRRLLEYAGQGLHHTYIMDLSGSEKDAFVDSYLYNFLVPLTAVAQGTEVTYNYRYESNALPQRRTRCCCGAASCSGWLGGLDPSLHLAAELDQQQQQEATRVQRQFCL
eukprot:gene4619-4873_t